MSRTIEERVVQMTFNNRQFETGVKESLSTLQKLKEATSSKAVGGGLEALTNAAKGVDLSPIASGIEAIQSRFSTLGIVGMTVIQDLTRKAIGLGSNLVNSIAAPIKAGGYARAMKLENAEFMLDGLLKDEARVAEVMANVSESVDGTAYGLDAAANTASQLVASGVQEGEQLTGVLKSVAGVAAMTNSSFEDIGNIMSTVYGQGKLMTMQLRQLEARGMNAAAVMAEYFGKTENEIRAMITNGSISADMFAEAMSTFSDQASKANETFEGSMANVRSALARTGAAFYAPFLKRNGPMVEFFNTLRLKINEMNKSDGMEALVEWFTNDLTQAIQFAQKVVDNFDIKSVMGGVAEFYGAARSLFMIFKQLVALPIKEAFEMAFPNATAENFKIWAHNVNVFISSLEDYFTNGIGKAYYVEIRAIFRGIFAFIKIAVRAVKDFWEAIAPLREAVGWVFFQILWVFDQFGIALELVSDDLEGMGNIFGWITPIAQFLADIIMKVVDGFSEWAGDAFYDRIHDGIMSIGSALGNIGPKIAGFLTSVFSLVKPTQIFHTVVDGVKSAIDKLTPHLKRGKDAIFSFFRSLSGETEEMDATDKFQRRVDFFHGVLEKLLNVLKAVGGVVKTVLSPLGAALKRFIGDITIKDITALGWTGVALMLADAFRKVKKASAGMWTMLKGNAKDGGVIGLLLGKQVTLTPGKINDTLTNIGNSLIKFNSALKTAMDLKMIETVAKSMILIAASIAILSFIPVDRLMNACVALAVAMGILVGAVKLLQESMYLIKSSELKTAPLIAMLLAISIALGIIAGAIAKMAKAAAKGTLFDGVLGMIFGMAALIVAVKFLSKVALDVNLKGLGLILIIALAISSISKSIVRLAKLNDGIASAIGVISMLFMLIAGIMILAAIVDANTTGPGPFLGMGVMIIAITILVKQITKLAKLDLKGVLTAVAAITLVLLAVAGFIALLGFIFRRGGGMGAGDTGILIGISASMILMAAAIRILASSLGALANLKPEALGNAVVALVVVLVSLAVACKLLSHAALGAVAIMVMTVALAALVPIIMTIGTFIGPFVIGIIGLAAALAVLTIAAIAIAPWIIFMAVAAAGIFLMGVAVGVLGAGLFILNTAIAVFAGSAVAFINMLELLVKTIADLLPYVIQKVVESIVVFFTSISEAAPQILGAIGNLIIGILQLLVEFIPAFAEVAVQLLVTVMTTIVEYLPVIVQVLFDFIVGLINGVADAIRNNGEAIFEAIDNLLSAIFEFLLQGISHIFGKIPVVGDAIQDWAEGAQGSVHKFFTGNELTKDVDEGVDAMASAAENGVPKMESAGDKLGEGLMSKFKSKLGLDDGSNSILNDLTGMFAGGEAEMGATGELLGGSLNGGIQSALGIGEEGGGSTIISDLTSSMTDSLPEVNETGVAIGDELTGGFSDSVENFDMTDLTNSFNLNFLTGTQNANPSAKETGGAVAEETMDGFEEAMVEVAAPGGEAFASEINSGFEEKMIEVAAPSGEGYGTQIISGLNEKMVEVAAPGGEDFAEEIDRGFDEKTVEVAAPSGNDFADEVIEGVAEREPNAKEAGASLANAGIEGASSKSTEWYSAGQNSGQGYADGLLSKQEAARAAGKAIVTAANKATKQAAEIKSPSRLFMADGVMSGLGYAMGLDESGDDVAKSGAGLVSTAQNAIMAGMNELSKLGDLSGLSATLTPVMDMSSTRAAISGLSNVELQNAKIGTTSQLNAAVNAQLMNNQLAADLARQNELAMVQNGIESQMLQQMREMAGQTSILQNLLRATQEGGNVYLDGNTLVGSISARMDRQLGIRAARAARGVK